MNLLLLLLLLTTLSFAYAQGMINEVDKIKNTMYRYIVLRMFYHNPHHSTFSLRKAPGDYFKFRYEEIYRAWILAGSNGALRTFLSQDALVDMYICTVQEKWWSDLTRNYSQEFTAHLIRKYQEAEYDLKHKFESTFKKFSDLTAFGMHPWMRETSDSSDSEAASQQPSPDTVSGPWQAPAGNQLFLQPPVAFSDSSVSTGRRRRHVRRETSVMQTSHQPIDLIDPTE